MLFTFRNDANTTLKKRTKNKECCYFTTVEDMYSLYMKNRPKDEQKTMIANKHKYLFAVLVLLKCMEWKHTTLCRIGVCVIVCVYM